MADPIDETTLTPGSVRLRFFAAAKQSAGVDAARWNVHAGDTIGLLMGRNGLGKDPVVLRSSFLLNGTHATEHDRVHPGDAVDVLPPFAGG